MEGPGSPEKVWEAIATGAGHAAWLFTAEIEARPGGAMVVRREPFGGDAVATVTAWDPPHRFAFEEPNAPGDGSTAPPLATEFLVEARSNGTCVVRVVAITTSVGSRSRSTRLRPCAVSSRPSSDHGIRAVSLHTGGVPATIPEDFAGRDAIVSSIIDATMLKRAATFDDIGDVTAFAASDRARTMTATALNITCGAVAD